jgi:OOP family OmpA-OmpF porin
MRLRVVLVSATLLGAPFLLAGTASAQPVSGLYVGAGGGGNVLQDETVRLSPEFPGGKERFDVGAAALGSAGYGFGNGLRVEAEGNWRYNGVQHFLGTPYPTRAGGEQQNYGVMVNALFDMDIGFNWIYPYFGVGAGYSWTRWDHVQAIATNANFAESASGTYGNVAYQGIFGTAFPVSYLPGLSLTAEYRFMSVIGPEQFNAGSSGTQGSFGRRAQGVARGNVDITSDYNHSFLVGLRYEFNPPGPAAPPPAVAVSRPALPAAARTYLVFFDWDRADLTSRARQIISEAAQASTRVQTTRIEVNGYTDLSGTAAYNQRLSTRRAESVEAELIHDGVAKSEIAIHGYGEASPLVPTAQGVREPQNRRVEIILH